MVYWLQVYIENTIKENEEQNRIKTEDNSWHCTWLYYWKVFKEKSFNNFSYNKAITSWSASFHKMISSKVTETSS